MKFLSQSQTVKTFCNILGINPAKKEVSEAECFFLGKNITDQKFSIFKHFDVCPHAQKLVNTVSVTSFCKQKRWHSFFSLACLKTKQNKKSF